MRRLLRNGLVVTLVCLGLAGKDGPLNAQTLTTVLDNGPSDNRIDLIFIGDGYTNAQLQNLYPSHVQQELDYLFSGADRNPFPRYQNFFNAHRVNIASNESGADQPPNGIFRDTALDATYWTGNIERCLYFDTFKANNAVNTALAGSGIDIDARLGLVNDQKYGGCGGQWAVYAARNSAALDIAVHELGHSLGNLADEYYTEGTWYTGPEPSSVNLTKSPATGKWDRWLGYTDPQTNVGAINYFEGGGYHEFGLFRPSDNSEMRSLFRPFDAVSREQFINKFYQEVDPLDAWLSNSSALQDPSEVWVETIDPNVIEVEWFIDGVSQGLLGETLDFASLNLVTGNYVVEALASDGILDHSFTGDALDWWRLPDTSSLQQSITWNVTISLSGDFNEDGRYDCLDADALVFEIVNQTGDIGFDLNGDGSVDSMDLADWLAEAGANELPSGNAFLPGDINLSGIVDGEDFLIWNDHKFSATAAWCAGDVNADGVTDGIDFTIWNDHKFTSSDSSISPITMVPEPGASWFLVVLFVGIYRHRSSDEIVELGIN